MTTDSSDSNHDEQQEEDEPPLVQELKDGKELFVGPTTAPWWKFKLAQKVDWLLRASNLRNADWIPFVSRLRSWTIEVCVLSREMEPVEPRE